MVSHTTANGTFYRQKTGIRSVTNPASNSTSSATVNGTANTPFNIQSGANTASNKVASVYSTG